MTSLLKRTWKEDQGVLTFEWILLITVLVIGVVGGLSAVRDGIISELGDLSVAITSVDQSFVIYDLDGQTVLFEFDDDPEYVAQCRPAEAPISPDGAEAQEGPVAPGVFQ